MTTKIYDDLIHQSICPECSGNLNYIPEKGEEVCINCGLVVSERKIDPLKSMDIYFSKEDLNKRGTRGNPVMPNISPSLSLSTVIKKDEINKTDLGRAVKWNYRVTWKERNFLIALTELKRISELLKIPVYVQSKATKIYNEMFERNAIRGRSIHSMVTACLFTSCRLHKFPRKIEELIDVSNEEGRSIRKSYRFILKITNLKIPSINYKDFVARYTHELGLTTQVESLADDILEKYWKKYSKGISAFGAIAGALYLASKLKGEIVTQKKIADIVNVTEVTLRSRFKEMLLIL